MSERQASTFRKQGTITFIQSALGSHLNKAQISRAEHPTFLPIFYVDKHHFIVCERHSMKGQPPLKPLTKDSKGSRCYYCIQEMISKDGKPMESLLS